MRFQGVRVSADARACEAYGVKRVAFERDRAGALSNVMQTRPGVIGSGANGGFQAINLAIQFGARVIILLGFDMHCANGVHWHGRHPEGLNNPDETNFARWRGYLEQNADRIASLGVEVINATPGSALTCFTAMDLGAALIRARLFS